MARVALQGAVSNHPFQITINSLPEKGNNCRRAKPGRFGSFSLAMKNRHFGGECCWTLAGKARKCGRFWVFACVPNPGEQSVWRQCPPSARKQSTKKLPNRPGFTHVQVIISNMTVQLSFFAHSPRCSDTYSYCVCEKLQM